MAKEFTDDNFQTEVIAASQSKPVLVDFFAAWCGPCKLQGPIVDEVSELMMDKAVIGKLDTEKAFKISQEYGVMSIPNLMVFRGGKVVENMIGLQSKETLVDVVKKHF